MRFAGQRFRAPRQARTSGKADSGYVGDFKASTAVQGLEQSMAQMPEKSVRSMSLTEFPDMSQSPFSAGNFQEPEFRV